MSGDGVLDVLFADVAVEEVGTKARCQESFLVHFGRPLVSGDGVLDVLLADIAVGELGQIARYPRILGLLFV